MKELFRLFLPLLFVGQIGLFAQKVNEGIYLSASDFDNHKISYSRVENKKYKFSLHETFNRPIIKITIGDSIIVLKKDSVFGYKDHQGVDYRFYNHTICQVINPSEKIIIYSKASIGEYKHIQSITEYFFSINSNSPIYPLSVQNLKKAFPDHPMLHELLDIYFRKDSELLHYDSYYNMYKLNRVYQISQQITIRIN